MSVSPLFPSFSHFSTQTSTSPSVIISAIRGGTGPPLLLLHGYPQTHLIWSSVAPLLLPHFTLIIPDLRGYGASSKPAAPAHDPADHSLYSKSTMAHDMHVVMTSAGFSTYSVLGHDRGARVAHKLAIDQPAAVRAVMLLDICSTLAMFNATNQQFATAYWHWFFLIQPAPFPERVMVAAPETMARKQLLSLGSLRANVDDAEHVGPFKKMAWEEYVRRLGEAESVHGMCEDYRAAATVDLDEQSADMESGRKIRCRLRVLWGQNGVVQKGFNALEEWGKISEDGCLDQKSCALPCGHYIPEEMPEELARHALEFFKE